METLKQSQFATKTQPEIFKMQQQSHRANLSNIYSTIAERKQNMFFKDQAYKEQVEAKNIMTDFNEFSLKNPHLKGDDLKNAFFQHLKYMQMAAFNDPLVTDTPTMIMNAQKYLDQQRLFEKHLGYAGQGYRANEDNFNPIPKGGNNGVNSGSDYSNALTQIGQTNSMKEQLVKDINATSKEIDDLQRKGVNTEELKTKKTQLEQKLSQLQGVPNTANAKSLMNYFTDSLGKTTGEKTYNQMIQYSQIKQDIAMVADAIDTVALYGWSGEALNRLGHMFGVATNKDDINNKIIALLNNIQGDTGTRLKQQYENIVKLTPNTSAFGMNVKRMQQELTNLNEHINININSTLYPHKENSEIIKKSFNISTKPLEFKYDYENYKKMALSEMEKDILKQYPNAKGINPNGTLRYY